MVSTPSDYGAILIPGGGVRENGKLPPWVQERLCFALEQSKNAVFILLSAGTTHKAPPKDAAGFPIFESVAGAKYLLQQGVVGERILVETSSYDTIGNAFFSRVIHVEPRKFRRLLVVTSQFHMPRTEAIFRWVYQMGEDRDFYKLDFHATPDVGMDSEVLAARQEKEAKSLKQFQTTKQQIHTLSELHTWLFTQHAAYAVEKFSDSSNSEQVQTSY